MELVNDFLKKAKQLEYLISVLPASPAQDDVEFAELENELKEVNEEYLSVLTEAGEPKTNVHRSHVLIYDLF